MATLQDNDQNPNGAAPNQPVTGGTSAAGSSGGAGVNGPNQAPVSPVQQNVNPQSSQGYTDVSSYLNANPTGGQQIGQGITSNLTQGYNTAKTGIDTSAQSANQAISSGYIPENTQLIQQVANNPTQAAADPNQVAAYQAQLNDQYTGPSNWADLGTQQGNVATAQQNANLLNTPGGSNVLVQQVENQANPGQTGQGINALDTLLFQGTPGAVQAAQTAAAPTASLTDYLNSQNAAITGNIQGAQTAAQQTAADALAAGTGAVTNLNQAVTGTANSDLATAQAQQTALQNDIANLYGGQAAVTTPTTQTGAYGAPVQTANDTNYTVGQLSPQDLQALGMTQDQWNQLQGALQSAGTSNWGTNGSTAGVFSPTTEINLENYLASQNPTSTGINAGTVATPQQYQEQAALNTLLGSQAPLQTEALNPAMASEAGTYNPTNLNQFNYQQALTDAQAAKTAENQYATQLSQSLANQANSIHAASQSHGGFLNTALGQGLTLGGIPAYLNYKQTGNLV